MKQLAILLTCHNRREKTLTCLEILFNVSIPNEHAIDVFLVDDGSSDGTSEAVSEQFPKTCLIHGDGNLFWNRGMYLAWETAAKIKDYDFYLWLNDDTTIDPKALIILLQTSKAFQHEAIVVGTTSAIQNHSWITYGGRKREGLLLTPTDRPVFCDYFNGNLVLFPKYVYQKIGTNDPFFRHALGDFDYGLRAAKANIKSVVAPGVLGQCDKHEALLTWCNPEKTFKQRWKAFRSPLGQNPEEFFVFEKRHRGIFMACFHYFTNHLRVSFPKMWKRQ